MSTMLNSKVNDMTLDKLIINKPYSFIVKLANLKSEKEYVGKFTVGVNPDNSIIIDLYYVDLAPYSYAMANITTNTESESNDTITVADVLVQGISMRGYISAATDIDYFKFVVPASGYIDIVLSVPDTINYDLELYASNGMTLINSSMLGTGKDESIRAKLLCFCIN